MAEKKHIWKDFKEFISKGNVIDMAVGVVIGASFSGVVNGLVTCIINPFVGIFTGHGGELSSLKTIITAANEEEGIAEVAIQWGTWIQSVLDFLITACCIFIITRILMRAKNLIEAKKIAEAKEKEEAAKAEAEAAKAEAKAAAEEAALKRAAIEESILKESAILEEISKTLKEINKHN